MTSMILFKSGRYYDYVDGYRGIIKGQNIIKHTITNLFFIFKA